MVGSGPDRSGVETIYVQTTTSADTRDELHDSPPDGVDWDKSPIVPDDELWLVRSDTGKGPSSRRSPECVGTTL